VNVFHFQAIQYVSNAGGNATIATFDDDHEPVGEKLRRELMPRYFVEESGKLVLTDEGRKELGR
jgi:hypothetical protein